MPAKHGVCLAAWIGCIVVDTARFGDVWDKYRGADKSLARPTSRCILFDGENILFDASIVIYSI